MLLSNCHVQFIFPLALTVEGSALGLIFFRFHSVCCFMKPEKILSFQTNNIILKSKIWWGNRDNMQDLFRGFLGPVNGPKNSILNWVSNLNDEKYLKTYHFFFCLQSLEKIRFSLHMVECLIRQISLLIFQC